MPKSTITGQSPVFYIYVLFRPWDGSPFYVGKGNGNRWTQHAKRGRGHIAALFRKAARMGLEVPVVKIREWLTEPDAFKIEIAFIAAIGRADLGLGPLANQTDGGEGAANPSAEIRIKRGSGWRGKTRSDETKAKIREVLSGHAVSPSAREKISLKSKEMWSNPELRNALIKSNRARQYSPSQEVRDRVSSFHRGRKHTAEAIEKMRTSALEREKRRRLARIGRIDADRRHYHSISELLANADNDVDL